MNFNPEILTSSLLLSFAGPKEMISELVPTGVWEN